MNFGYVILSRPNWSNLRQNRDPVLLLEQSKLAANRVGGVLAHSTPTYPSRRGHGRRFAPAPPVVPAGAAL